MERDLRVVGAGLDAEVAARLRRIELIALELGEVDQLGRALRGEPVAVVEDARAESERQREPGRSEPSCLARVIRWSELAARVGGRGVTGAVARGGGRPGGQEIAHVGRVRGREVEAREAQMVLLRRHDPGLMRAVERHRLVEIVGVVVLATLE